jgi:hypothetical protein
MQAGQCVTHDSDLALAGNIWPPARRPLELFVDGLKTVESRQLPAALDVTNGQPLRIGGETDSFRPDSRSPPVSAGAVGQTIRRMAKSSGQRPHTADCNAGCRSATSRDGVWHRMDPTLAMRSCCG